MWAVGLFTLLCWGNSLLLFLVFWMFLSLKSIRFCQMIFFLFFFFASVEIIICVFLPLHSINVLFYIDLVLYVDKLLHCWDKSLYPFITLCCSLISVSPILFVFCCVCVYYFCFHLSSHLSLFQSLFCLSFTALCFAILVSNNCLIFQCHKQIWIKLASEGRGRAEGLKKEVTSWPITGVEPTNLSQGKVTVSIFCMPNPHGSRMLILLESVYFILWRCPWICLLSHNLNTWIFVYLPLWKRNTFQNFFCREA